ncbi:MAG: dTMP kinase [Spirochaetaceae bacterium]|jgi:dTMP kinase|nr:dTMP kinase [Spirochaetaceae bacterium]
MLIIQNFAVFEGGDGSGTTTQIVLLKERYARLREAQAGPAAGPGIPPLHLTYEPTAGPIGVMIRSALRGELSLRPETCARLFAADRNEHLYGAGGVAERCARGELVVSDRYVLSSLVYQGLDCGEELPWSLNRGFPGPELLFFFDLDPEIAMERIRSRPGRDLYERLDFQIRVRERYRALLPEFERAGVRVLCIDASQSAEESAALVWAALEKMPIMKG